jgi:hypothetical protein
MPVIIAFYDSTDSTILTTVTLTATAGTPSTPLEIHLWNDFGGSTADTSIGDRLLALVRNPGETAYLGAGRPPVDEGWIEVRELSALGAALPLATGPWTPLGAARWLALPDLPQNSGVALQVRLNVPLYVTWNVVLEVSFSLDRSPYWSTAIGGSETSADGVVGGLGDGAFSDLILCGDVIPIGTPGSSVQVPYVAWISGGLPYGAAANATLTPDATDSASASLSSGEGYWGLLAAAPDGTRPIVKGLKAAVGDAVKPDLPAGFLPIAYILRDQTAVINSANIINVWRLGRFALATSGLAATVAPGLARQNNVITLLAQPTPITLTASSTTYIYLDRGMKASVTAPASNLRPLALWEIDTDGSGVTAIRDRRRLVGLLPARRRLRFNATLAETNLSDLDVIESLLPTLLDPERPCMLALDDLGSLPLSGGYQVDIKTINEAGSAVSIFPNDASKLKIAYTASTPIMRVCSPTVLIIPAGVRLQARIDFIPTGTTAATGASVVIGGG